jgi:hypothetical protein
LDEKIHKRTFLLTGLPSQPGRPLSFHKPAFPVFSPEPRECIPFAQRGNHAAGRA